MREFNKVSPKVWRGRKFRALPSNDARLLFVYLITCEHQNSSGCFRLPNGYAVHDLGWETSIYSEKLLEVEASGLIVTDTETSEIFIREWFETNPAMSKKHAIGIERIISTVESDKLREIVEAEFEASRAGIEAQPEGKSGLEAIHRGIHGGLDRDGDETEKNTKTEKKTFYANLQKPAASSSLCHFALERVKSSPSRFHNRMEAA